MRVMFTVSDYSAHYFPMVPLGWALQAAGHEVRLVCGPAQHQASANTGLVLESNGTDVDTVVQARIGHYLDARSGAVRPTGFPPLNPLTGEEMASLDDFDWAAYEPEYFSSLAADGRTRARAIVGFAKRWRPDLVVHDLMSPEGMLAAHVTGVPSICHLWGPTGTDETGPGSEALSPDVPPAIRERLGIDPDLELLTHVIDPCPEILAPPTRAKRLPVRFTPYNGPGSMEPWVLDKPRKPRVCLVWSNSLTQLFGPLSFVVPDVVRACEGLGVELVLLLNEADARAVGPVPEYVTVLKNFPVHLLMPTCAAVVHHGGAGSSMTAMAAGVPQLALPLGPVLETIASRFAAAGAGISIRGCDADVPRIAAALSALLHQPKYAAAASAIAAINASRPSQADLVGVLEDIQASAPKPALTA